MQDVKQKFLASGILVGMDAQVEVKPHQEPCVGGGTRMYHGNEAKECEMETQFECLFMEWITKHDVKLANTLSKGWEPTRVKTDKLDFWKPSEMRLQKWKITDYIAVHFNWETRNLLRSKLNRPLACVEACKTAWAKRAVGTQQQCGLERMEAHNRKNECGFGIVIVKSLEAAEDEMGVPKAARAVDFESAGGRTDW